MAEKCKPMTKEEAKMLVFKIKEYPVIFSRVTNGTNNNLKDKAWADIALCLNAKMSTPRTPDQFRLKWENMKKMARKRNAKIKENNNKTGGGPPDFIPKDEVMDMVAEILGPTCDGYTVPLGGDAVNEKGEDDTLDLTEDEIPHSNSQPKKYFFGKTTKNNVKVTKKQRLNEDAMDAKMKKDNALAAYFLAKTEKVMLENENLKLENEKLKLQIELINKE